MLFEDKDGKILTMEEVNNLMMWELDEKKIHTHMNNRIDERTFGLYSDYLDEDM